MATLTQASSLGNFRNLSADVGDSVSAGTKTYKHFIPGTKWFAVTGNVYTTATVLEVGLCPWLQIFKTTDALAAEANYTNYQYEAQDGDTATSVTLSSLDTAANSDFLYVGCEVPFAGVTIDVDGTNGNASVLTVNYWDGSSWTDISDTDGTASGGATMAQDGDVTWTIPSDWVSAPLFNSPQQAGPGDTTLHLGVAKHPMYWTRWEVSAALDASVTLDSMLAIPVTTVGSIISGQTHEQSVTHGPGGYSAVQLDCNAGSVTAIVNVAGRHFP